MVTVTLRITMSDLFDKKLLSSEKLTRIIKESNDSYTLEFGLLRENSVTYTRNLDVWQVQIVVAINGALWDQGYPNAAERDFFEAIEQAYHQQRHCEKREKLETISAFVNGLM